MADYCSFLSNDKKFSAMIKMLPAGRGFFYQLLLPSFYYRETFEKLGD